MDLGLSPLTGCWATPGDPPLANVLLMCALQRPASPCPAVYSWWGSLGQAPPISVSPVCSLGPVHPALCVVVQPGISPCLYSWLLHAEEGHASTRFRKVPQGQTTLAREVEAHHPSQAFWKGSCSCQTQHEVLC